MLSAREIEVRESIDHLFRRHAGQMVSVLARIFSFNNLDLIEDAVQDALVASMKKWPFSGMPENPRAWLTEAAKNRVIDQLRRSGKSESLADNNDIEATLASLEDSASFTGEITEDELQMIFACCHPAIPPDSQVALTLKIVGGFGISEIARAFLAKEESIAKMLTRAKAKLREVVVLLEIPSQNELLPRREAVLKVLYLMFNEGYAATGGDELVRKDLCFEAIRLCSIIAEHPVTRSPRVHALMALFLFQGARLSTRIDRRGELLLLADQDRSVWDKEMLVEGLRHFQLSASGNELTNYHLEAEIAALHATAEDFESTEWQRILECYDELQRRNFSPVAELNRIVVIEKLQGAGQAFKALERLAASNNLCNFNLFHVTKAHLLAEIGNRENALESFEKALALTTNQPVRRFLERRIEALEHADTLT